MKRAAKQLRSSRGCILASTTGGNDLRSVWRVLMGVACAIACVLLMSLMTNGLEQQEGLMALLPALGGGIGGLLGMYVLGPKCIPQPASHFIEFRGDTLKIHLGEGDTHSFRNASLEVEQAAGVKFPSVLKAKGERFDLVACYTVVDESRLLHHLRSGRGVAFRSPRIELRAHKGMLHAVRIVASGRYSSTEEPFC